MCLFLSHACVCLCLLVCACVLHIKVTIMAVTIETPSYTWKVVWESVGLTPTHFWLVIGSVSSQHCNIIRVMDNGCQVSTRGREECSSCQNITTEGH